MIPPQKQMTGMLGHPVAENPIDRMFDAVYAHYGLPWQFWKNNIATESDLRLAVAALVPLGYRGMCVTVPYKVAVIPLLDANSINRAPFRDWPICVRARKSVAPTLLVALSRRSIEPVPMAV
jgi:hypothetical protein